MYFHLTRHAAAVGAALGFAACSPTYDWRDTQPPEAALVALFPCKPDSFSRPQKLAGIDVQMGLVSCEAGGTTFALSHVQLPDVAQVTPALAALRKAAADNVGSTARVLAPMALRGMTPNPLAERLQIDGRRADGSVMRVQAAFFTAGSRVYQATMVGSALDADAVDTFFGGVRLPQ